MSILIHVTLRNLFRRPIRTLTSLTGLALSIGVLACLLSFSRGYETSLHGEIDRMGMQIMLVPLGCPYDAAARVLKGRSLDTTLPEGALASALADPGVAVAAPIFTAAVPRPRAGRTDLWVGIDGRIHALKPWWHLTEGSSDFRGPDSILLGSDAAATEMRRPGDRFFSPETGRRFVVSGVLTRSGTSDDSQFFVPLRTAQAMFHAPGRLTGIEIRLKDPTQVGAVAARLQATKGAQVVTLTEMMGVFLTLLSAARKLILAITILAVTVGALGAFNTMMAAALERAREMSVLRALGMSRRMAFALMIVESLLLAFTGGAIGFVVALAAGPALQIAVRSIVPFAPSGGMPLLTGEAVRACTLLIVVVGVVVGLYPAWRCCRVSPAAALRAE